VMEDSELFESRVTQPQHKRHITSHT